MAAADITAILARDPLDVDALGRALDALDDRARVALVRSWGKDVQRRLWAACEGRRTTLDDFVPPGVAPRTEVVHAGRNSLPVFTRFEKRFTRVPGRDDVLYGYNEGPTRAIVGPGYYVAHVFSDRGEVGIDYLETPEPGSPLPATWPEIRTNESGLQKFVYAGMVDFMRKVSSHVTIGRAYKRGEDALPHTFLLVRTGG
jgi:hypothetical protein